MGFSVPAMYDERPTSVTAWERARTIEIKLNRVTDQPHLTPAEARAFAKALYSLAARLEKRLVKQQSAAASAEAPALPEGRDEARPESEAAPQAAERADGERVLETAG